MSELRLPQTIDIEDDPAQDWLVIEHIDDEGRRWRDLTLGEPPSDLPDLHLGDDQTPGVSYWNGREWIPL